MIVHIAHQLPPETHGGVESYVLALSRAQRERGQEVFLIAGSLNSWQSVGGELEKPEGGDVYRVHRQDLYFDAWDRMYCPQMADLILRKLEELQPDVVHLHHWIRLSQDLGQRIVEAGFKLVITLHDLATSCPRGFRMKPDETPCLETLSVENCLHCAPRWPWMSDDETARELEVFARSCRSEIASAHAVLCASNSVKSVVTNGLSAPDLSSRIRVFPFGHDPVFAAQDCERPSDPDVFRFAYWGSITHRKGVELLVGAFSELLANRNDSQTGVELHIFGVCDLEERNAALTAAATGLPITFHGRFEYDDIVRAGIDAAVFPSLCIETYGMVLDEAFELGVPVIVSDIGAFKERAGLAGKLFEVNNAGSLACALGALVDDPALYAQLKGQVPQSLSPFAAHVDAVLDVYREPTCKPLEGFLPVSTEERVRHQFLRAQPQFNKLLEKGEGQGYGPM